MPRGDSAIVSPYQQARRWVIGLCSGSTVDGVDAALLQVDGVGLEMRPRLLHTLHLPYPRDVRAMIRQAAGPVPVRQVSLLDRLTGEAFALAAAQVADQGGVGLPKVQCLGCAGHTLWHEPDARYPFTLGVGMPALVAEKTGVTTVSDFRSRDLALGGQGLPLTALVDYLLFRDAREPRVLVNLGGVSSVVHLPAGGSPGDVVGFQAGPCNIFLDGLMTQLTGGREPYDAWGKHAVQGKCIDALMRKWANHPVLQRKPPKHMPREEFGDEFVSQTLQQAKANHWSLHDVLCTATHLVAHGVITAIERFLPQRPRRVILSGGGVRNGLLWQLLEQKLAGVELCTIEHYAIPLRARKAVGFGGLAALLLDGVPGNLTSVTGASGSRLLGNLTPGSPANWSRCLNWMANQTPSQAAA